MITKQNKECTTWDYAMSLLSQIESLEKKVHAGVANCIEVGRYERLRDKLCNLYLQAN